jgi:protein-S-isoprenylcysteine O-methyltransferase Ste14
MSISQRVIPPVYFFVTLLLMFALHYFFPIKAFTFPFMSYFAGFLIVLGFAFVLWSAFLFGKVGTPIRPFQETTQLVKGGMYRVTRNPMYLGLSVILIGIAFLLGSVSPFIPIPFFIWLIHNLFIIQEELILEENFGDEYIEYKLSVRRWL